MPQLDIYRHVKHKSAPLDAILITKPQFPHMLPLKNLPSYTFTTLLKSKSHDNPKEPMYRQVLHTLKTCRKTRARLRHNSILHGRRIHGQAVLRASRPCLGSVVLDLTSCYLLLKRSIGGRVKTYWLLGKTEGQSRYASLPSLRLHPLYHCRLPLIYTRFITTDCL